MAATRMLCCAVVMVGAVGCGGARDTAPPDEWQEGDGTRVEVRHIDTDGNGYPDRELRTERDDHGNLKRVRVTDRDGERGPIVRIEDCTYDPYRCERRTLKWDDSGELSELHIDFDGDGRDDEVDYFMRVTEPEGDTVGRRVLVFDGKGKLTRTKLVLFDEKMREKEIRYDDDGDGTIDRREEIHYDSAGNVGWKGFDDDADGDIDRIVEAYPGGGPI